MKLVVQRVRSARCWVADRVTGEIGRGLVIFVGIESSDAPETAEQVAGNVPTLKVFEDDTGNLGRTLEEVDGDLLVVPNFTVCARFSGGGRPSFDGAAPPARAEALYEEFVEKVKPRVETVETGEFGSNMRVEADNDGPVTLVLDV